MQRILAGKTQLVLSCIADPTREFSLYDQALLYCADIFSRIATRAGARVVNVCIVNDYADEKKLFAESVLRKYFAKQGIPTEYPQQCYPEPYIDILATKLHLPNYNVGRRSLSDIKNRIQEKLVAVMVADAMKKDLQISGRKKIFVNASRIVHSHAALPSLNIRKYIEQATTDRSILSIQVGTQLLLEKLLGLMKISIAEGALKTCFSQMPDLQTISDDMLGRMKFKISVLMGLLCQADQTPIEQGLAGISSEYVEMCSILKPIGAELRVPASKQISTLSTQWDAAQEESCQQYSLSPLSLFFSKLLDAWKENKEFGSDQATDVQQMASLIRDCNRVIGIHF